MKIFKMFKAVAGVGEKVADGFTSVVDFADRIVHREQYARARRRRVVWTVILAVAGGIIAVLLFPYRIIVKKNGDFEVRSLLLRVYRRSPEYAIPEGGADSFEIAEADIDETDVIEA